MAQFLGTSSYVEDFTKFKGYEAYQPKKGTGAVIRSEFMEKALQSIGRIFRSTIRILY